MQTCTRVTTHHGEQLMGGVFNNRSKGNLLDELRAVLFDANPAATEKWFQGRPESERKELAAHCLGWFKKVHSYRFSYPAKPKPDFDPKATDEDAFHSGLVAWFASTNAPSALVRLGWRGVPPAEYVLAIVRDRKPAWIDTWVEIVSDNVYTQWPLVRSLVKAGLCRVPECDGYTLGMISHYSGYYNRQRDSEFDLREDPGLFEDEIWRIFRVEGNADASLSMARGWSEALLELIEDGTLERDRVVRETLSALSRDFSKHKAGFYSRFYGMLKVEPGERCLYTSHYLGLLASRVGPTQSLAINELLSLHQQGVLGAEEFLGAVSPALTTKSKSTALEALGLIDTFAEANPKLAEQCCQVALDGFDHIKADVHAAVASIIERHGMPEWTDFAQALNDRMADVVASQRPRLQSWLGQEMAEDIEAPVIDWKSLEDRAELLSPEVKGHYGIDRLLQRPAENVAILVVPWGQQRHLRDAIEPIVNSDELIALVAHVVEGEASADDVERALDGISRLCAEKAAGFEERSGPLKKRVLGLLKKVRSFKWTEMKVDLWRIVQAWLEGEFDNTQLEVPSTIAFWQHRTLRIAKRVAKNIPCDLLSTPTHSGGWIDPRVFVQRLREQLDDELDSFELILGMLRLAPEFRTEALSQAQALTGEVGAAVRHALGSDNEEIGDNSSLWITASRARNPYEDDDRVLAKHPGHGADAAQACRYVTSIELVARDYVDGQSIVRVLSEESEEEGRPTLVITRTPAVVIPTDFDALPPLLHQSGDGGEHSLRWLATAWPAGREAWFARGAEALYNNMDWHGAEWQNHVYLDTLFDYRPCFGEIPRLCLAVGLTAKEPREVALATDVLIAALEDGRLTGAALGDTMRGICHRFYNRKYKWPPSRAKAARWAKTLGEAARVSALHAEEVRIAIEHSIAFSVFEDALKDQAALFSLLLELCVEAGCGVQNTQVREFLGSYVGSSKAAKLAKACLALPGEASQNAEAALAQVLEARLRQAEVSDGAS